MTQRRDIIEMVNGRSISGRKYRKNTSIFNGAMNIFEIRDSSAFLIALSDILSDSYHQYFFCDSIR
jgi:hypothetical protein